MLLTWVVKLANLDEHVCEVVGRKKWNKFRSDLPGLVVSSEDEVLGLPVSQQVCVEERCYRNQWIYSEMDQQQFCGVKSSNRKLSGVGKEDGDPADCLKM